MKHGNLKLVSKLDELYQLIQFQFVIATYEK